jgi:hypothetical protein
MSLESGPRFILTAVAFASNNPITCLYLYISICFMILANIFLGTGRYKNMNHIYCEHTFVLHNGLSGHEDHALVLHLNFS